MKWGIRFFFLCLSDYLLATALAYAIAEASTSVFDMPRLVYAALLFLPLSTIFFSWIFYRHPSFWVVSHPVLLASLWVGLSAVIDVALAIALPGPFFVSAFISPFVLALYGLKFFAVFGGAYLAGGPFTLDVSSVHEDGGLLPRSL